jgi:REP element-mobilizing transposase RayT
MYKKREFTEGAFYHVTSRTNDKIRVFANKLGRKIILIVLQAAKNKFRFTLTNFCIMPTHIHLLIKPIGAKIADTEFALCHYATLYTRTRNRISFHGAHGHLKVPTVMSYSGLFLRRDCANAILQRLLTRRFIGPQICLVVSLP